MIFDCFFISDIHGNRAKYDYFFDLIEKEPPQIVFLGGDLLPSGLLAVSKETQIQKDFINEVLIKGFGLLKKTMGKNFPRIFLILGNDDCKSDEESILKGQDLGLWEYIHDQRAVFDEYVIYGYSNIPPSPFYLKDFEKYDVSRYVDPGCIPPEEGSFTVPVNKELLKISTIKKDLELLIQEEDLSKMIILFHCPPYETKLDRAALDDKYIDHVPLDVHIGSIAIQRFISQKQPYITLHGHVHESPRLTGTWKDKIKDTSMFSAAHDSEELAVIKFNLKDPESAIRVLYQP